MSGAFVAIIVVLIAVGGITVMVATYFSLQRHRADAVAMAAYRKLAEEAVANQAQLHDQLAEIGKRLTAVEQLLRSVE